MNEQCFEYIERNEKRFIKELEEFLKIPSVSADARYKEDMKRCALWLVEHFKSIGLEARVISTKGHPIVWAKGKGQSGKKLIIYGHYDVQPAEETKGWETPPFKPDIRDGYIYARGATDDKGQLFAHIKAVESLMKTNGQLPREVVFLLEGEEECVGSSLEEYIRAEKANLDADAVIVSDMTMYDENTPAITYGLRGTVRMEVKVRTAERELHSGAYGGAVGNAVTALASIISQCAGPDGKIKIPGFYDDVLGLRKREKENIAKLEYDDKKFAAETATRKTFGEAGFSTLERMWTRPTFEINGISGGYEGEGIKTIIPACATAKISMRLVPNQNPQAVGDIAAEYIKKVCPDYANVEIEGLHGCEPILFDINDPMMRACKEALKEGFGAEPVYIRCGGSISVVNAFWKELRKPVVMMGFGLDSDGAHSVNERFKIDSFIKGIKASAHLISTV